MRRKIVKRRTFLKTITTGFALSAAAQAWASKSEQTKPNILP